MTIQITLSPEDEARLRAQAAEAETDAATYASEVLSHMLRRPSLAELLASIREGIGPTDATEEELDKLIEQARTEVWNAHQRENVA